MTHATMSAERERLLEVPRGRPPWRRWGPYLSERAWGTVREDYSAGGYAWEFFPHDHARSRAYRWNEDGLGGICDDRQILCFAFAFWNGADPILKERIFGLTGSEGNHGEDAKEYWYYLDSTPAHSWMRWRYMYPQAEYPYGRLLEENRARGRLDPEFELVGGLLLIAGLFTRPAALLLAGDMIGAILVSGIAKSELISLTLAPAELVAMLVLLWMGPGRYLIDLRRVRSVTLRYGK